MLELLLSYQSQLEKVFLVLVSLWISYRLGFVSYLRNKEHDLVVKRYLEGGIDSVSGDFHKAIAVFTENHSLIQSAMDDFRKHKEGAFLNAHLWSEPRFTPFDPKPVTMAPYFRLTSLVGKNIYAVAAQQLFSLVWTSRLGFEKNVQGLAMLIKDRPANLSELFEDQCRRVHEASSLIQRYFSFVQDLEGLSHLLEQSKLTFSSLGRFRQRRDVKDILQRSERTLQEYAEQEKRMNG